MKQRPPYIAVLAWRQIEIAAGTVLTSRALFGGRLSNVQNPIFPRALPPMPAQPIRARMLRATLPRHRNSHVLLRLARSARGNADATAHASLWNFAETARPLTHDIPRVALLGPVFDRVELSFAGHASRGGGACEVFACRRAANYPGKAT